MGRLDNIAGGVGNAISSAILSFRLGMAKADIGNVPWLMAQAEEEKWKPPNLAVTKNQELLYAQLSWFAVAVNHVAEQAAGTKLNIKTLEGEKRVDIENHPFEVLLGRPNDAQSRFEFLGAWLSYWKITGDGFVWLNRTSEDNPPDEMWVIPSHKIIPIPDEQLYIRGYMYDSGRGEQILLQPWEVVQLRKFHPLKPYEGLSAVEQIATVATGDLKMQEWNTNYFGKNNAKVPGLLTFADPINNSDWERLQRDYKDQHGGTKRNLMMLRNTGRGGVDWVATTMSQKDMEFLNARNFNKEEIYSVLAPGLASWLDVNSTEANSVTGKAAFRELAVWPAHQALAQKITNDVLPAYGDNLVAEFEDVRIEDKDQQLREQAAYSLTHTVEEIRERFYDDDPLGDERDTLFPSEITSSGGLFGEEPFVQESPEELETGKAHEIGQFRRFAQKRISEGNFDKIASFKFKHLDLQDQAAIKSEFALDDLKALAELKASIDEVRAQGKTESINRWEGEIVKLREAVNERQPITVKVDAPTVENKIELPEPKVPVVNVKAQAPGAVIENVVNVPEPKVVFETGTEDIEVLEREPDGKLKKLRKTKKK